MSFGNVEKFINWIIFIVFNTLHFLKNNDNINTNKQINNIT